MPNAPLSLRATGELIETGAPVTHFPAPRQGRYHPAPLWSETPDEAVEIPHTQAGIADLVTRMGSRRAS